MTKRRHLDPAIEAQLKAIAERVKSLRVDRDGISQAELERLADIGRGTVQRIESLQRPEISALVLASIARALNVRLDWLVWGDEGDALGSDELAYLGLDLSAVGFLNQVHRLPKLLPWLETHGAKTPMYVVARGLKVFREKPPSLDDKGVPVGGWSSFFGSAALKKRPSAKVVPLTSGPIRNRNRKPR